jgi:hypothetical protein
MAFQKPQPRTPVSIKNIVITLRDFPAVPGTGETPAIPARQAIEYQFQVMDANGDRIPLKVDAGDLEPHLSAAQVNQIKTFLANIRAKIEAELL